MVEFEKFRLSNGLKVIVHTDRTSPLVAFNILYGVGSKDENPSRTGFAHLFEHLMFGGSEHIPDFDEPIQLAGGENNAFTNADITNYYNVIPKENVETIFWLESDRMKQLKFNQKSLEVQKKVVLEEFKETCLNKPFGDMWHHMTSMIYKNHPYRWPTIGLTPSHIEDSKLEDVKTFFYNFYSPNNAIICLSGHISIEEAKLLASKWFSDIPHRPILREQYHLEQPQKQTRRKTIRSDVPCESMYLGFPMCERLDNDYYVCDLISDIFANGKSSRFYQKLYREQQLFSHIDAYISGAKEEGVFMIAGMPMPGVTMEKAKQTIWQEIELLQQHGIDERELKKLINKTISALMFAEVNILHKAMNLSYFEFLGDAELINKQAENYEQISAEDIVRVANKFLTPEKSNELMYFPFSL